MRLKTKLVLAATGVTLAIVVVLSVVFLGELLRQRIAQTAGTTDVMARQVRMMTQQAIQVELRAQPPTDSSDEALHAAVTNALRSHSPLTDVMQSFVLYSSSVQDVSVTDAHGRTLVTTDPEHLNRQAPARMAFDQLQEASVGSQVYAVLGKAIVLDVTAPLDRNGKPFLIVHVGVRSTFLKNSYLPRLKDGLLLAALCAFISMMAAGLLANVASRPIEEIRLRLERLTAGSSMEEASMLTLGDAYDSKSDAVVRVTNTIDRLGRQIRTTEAVYTDLQANLNQMLDTLRDGVVLFTAEGRAVMVSDAVAHFSAHEGKPLIGLQLKDIFPTDTALGKAMRQAFEREQTVTAETVRMEDGREVEFSLDRIDDGQGRGRKMGTLLTLRDKGAAARLEQELEVARRLAAGGRLTAGVGHEVKNPINAMVVHLELLKAKLETAGEGRSFLAGAQRHVQILAGEMERLDHVVQTLADFTRPMDLRLEEVDLASIVRAVVELTGAEMQENGVELKTRTEAVMVRADGEMLRQALLNLVLNGTQAMEATGGVLRVQVRREGETAVMEVADEGQGIPPELMSKIFDLYFTTKPKGSGIGLAMTYRIVQMHGGAMEVRSEAGQGAVFTMRLPALAMSESRSAGRVPAGRSA